MPVIQELDGKSFQTGITESFTRWLKDRGEARHYPTSWNPPKFKVCNTELCELARLRANFTRYWYYPYLNSLSTTYSLINPS